MKSDLGKLIIDKFNTTKISDTVPIFNKDNIINGEKISGTELLDRLIERKIIITSLNILYDLDKNTPFEN